jgi:glucan phosphoethanolaminetransferase (alkaline phosphatase superfamily)
LDKYIDFVILLLLSILLGSNFFLTFVVAPQLFSNFDHRLAGEITNVIFPYYFAGGWIIGITIYTLIAIKSIRKKEVVRQLKWFVIALSLLIISYMALHRTLLPIGQSLNSQYYELIDQNKKQEAEVYKKKFATLHAVSSSLNLVNLLIEIYLIYGFYVFIRKEKDIP